MSIHRIITNGALTALAATSLVACSDSTAPKSANRRTVTLSVATTGSATVGQSERVGAGVITVGSGSQLVITRAQLVLRDVKLESPTFGCGDDSTSARLSVARFSRGSDDSSDDLDEDCGEMELGPVLVDLPLDSRVTQTISVEIPEGTYNELKLRLKKPDDDSSRDLAFLSANPQFRDVSVRVEGTYNGQAFTWVSRVDAEMELDFFPPITVGADGANVTLEVDVASWFRDGSGEAIDPANAQGDTTTRARIESNIVASFEAFEDDDRDGDDDNDDGSDD